MRARFNNEIRLLNNQSDTSYAPVEQEYLLRPIVSLLHRHFILRFNIMSVDTATMTVKLSQRRPRIQLP